MFGQTWCSSCDVGFTLRINFALIVTRSSTLIFRSRGVKISWSNEQLSMYSFQYWIKACIYHQSIVSIAWSSIQLFYGAKKLLPLQLSDFKLKQKLYSGRFTKFNHFYGIQMLWKSCWSVNPSWKYTSEIILLRHPMLFKPRILWRRLWRTLKNWFLKINWERYVVHYSESVPIS